MLFDKSPFASKTLWFNVLTAALALLQGPLGTSISPDTLVLILAAGNFVLRFLNTKQIALVK